VDEAHGKSEGVYSKGGVPRVEKNGLAYKAYKLFRTRLGGKNSKLCTLNDQGYFLSGKYYIAG